jgi:hypothetical protein
MDHALQLIAQAGYIGFLLLGWWAPGALLYLFGLVFLIVVRRRPRLFLGWSVVFLCCLAYTLYDGVYLRWRFDQRAAQYKGIVTLGPVPSEIRTILIERDRPTNTLTGNGQECSFVCAKLLFGGRFDSVIIPFKDPATFHYGVEPPSRPVAPQHYKTYTRIDQPGCQSVQDTSLYSELKAWELFGTCVVERKSATLPDGPRIEVLLDEDAPNNPPWAVQAEHVRAVDANGIRDIARVEFSSVDFAFWLPVPGFFPHGSQSGFPTDWRPGFLSFRRIYGPAIGRREAISRILGVSFEGRIPVPEFEKLSPEDRLRLTRQILLKGRSASGTNS